MLLKKCHSLKKKKWRSLNDNWNLLYKSQHSGLTNITLCNNMDICGPNWTQNSSIYSGRLESPPPSQYIPSLFSSRNGYGQSKRTTTETPEEPEKHQYMSEDEEKQFVLQKNGNYTGSFQFQEHGVECVQGECVLSHLEQQE